MKKNLIFASFAVLILISALFIWLYFSGKKPDPNMALDYYEILKSECGKEDNCCLSSVEHMQKNNYKLAERNWKRSLACQNGYSKNMMKCPTSYAWCVRVQKSSK